MREPERWGHLRKKYEEARPRRLLALDGGGIRGILTLQILKKLETILGKATGEGQAFRLGDYFDYVGGTSTGAIISAGIARGLRVSELETFYRDAGPDMFRKNSVWQTLQKKAIYGDLSLSGKLKEVFGSNTDLSPEHLRTLLLVVTRNATTDSAWPVSSNPEAKYNDPARPDCNLRIPLWQLVRASTAAPVYFSPELLNLDSSQNLRTFVFVDGGVTPYNNPSVLLFRMATHSAYRLNWPAGEDKLLLISIGTGAAPTLGSTGKNAFSDISSLTGLPGAFMYGVQVEQDIVCRTIGRCVYGDPVDRELGTMIDEEPESPGRAFRYARYNADLSPDGLNRLGCGDLSSENLLKLDNVTRENIEGLSRIGEAVARKVVLDHFKGFV